MALIEIEYGSLASSEVINQNNLYLENKIAEVSQAITSSTASINSNIATINGSINTLSQNTGSSISTINQDIETINTDIASSGLYTTTYYNSDSWYREYFSDKSKTTRVWLEQGSKSPRNGLSTSVSFIKAYNNTPTILMGEYETGGSHATVSCIDSVSTAGFTWSSASGVDAMYWYACGY